MKEKRVCQHFDTPPSSLIMYGDYFTSTFFPLMIYKPRVVLFTR